MHQNPTNVLGNSKNDPSGGPGKAADTQTLAALSAHPAPVTTTLTVQDTRNAGPIFAGDADLVASEAETVLNDLEIESTKIGLPGNAATVVELPRAWPDIPVHVPHRFFHLPEARKNYE